MLLNDRQIRELAKRGMIQPYTMESVKSVELIGNGMSSTRKIMSYGLGSFGYDLRLSPKEFKTFHRVAGTVTNPKRFSADNLEAATLQHDSDGDYFILPAHSYGLGCVMEQLNIPRDVTVLFDGKSSYSRAGIVANVTAAESGWRGHLTIQLTNSSSADCRVYANEGILQALFFKGEPCEISYSDRAGGGKYQDQGEEVTVARV